MSQPEGYWYTRANGEREWRDRSKCECGGVVESHQLVPMDEAEEGERIAELICGSCGKLHLAFIRPTEADLERGRELAARYGW